MRHRGEKNWEGIRTPREVETGPNPIVSCKPVQEFGTNKASRRRGRRLPGKRGKELYSWQREQHVQRLKETDRTSVWLQRPDRWEEMKAEAGEAGRGWPLKSPAPG